MIIGLIGKNQRESADICVGHYMKYSGMIDEFRVEDGELHVLTDVIDNHGNKLGQEYKVFNYRNEARDPEFDVWARKSLWPWVKCYSLKRKLKNATQDLFNLPQESIYSEVDTETALDWMCASFMPGAKEGRITTFEAIELFRTFVDTVAPDAYIESLIGDVQAEVPRLAIIEDITSKREQHVLKQNGVNLVTHDQLNTVLESIK